MSFHVPEHFRVLLGPQASDRSAGNNGAFRLRLRFGQHLFAIASDGLNWEHVSVSHPSYTPTWEQMCEVKALFWDPEDLVLQFHPSRSEYVNCHPHCLHLWRPVGVEVARPPIELVGPRL